MATFYVSTYCNFAHDVKTGKPINHECRIIPPEALKLEMEDDIQGAIDILANTPPVIMRRGMKEPRNDS